MSHDLEPPYIPLRLNLARGGVGASVGAKARGSGSMPTAANTSPAAGGGIFFRERGRKLDGLVPSAVVLGVVIVVPLLAMLAGCSSDCLKIQQCSQGFFGRSCSMVCPPAK